MIGEPTNIFDHDDDDEAGTAVEFSWSALHLRNGRRQVDELGHKIRDMEEEERKKGKTVFNYQSSKTATMLLDSEREILEEWVEDNGCKSIYPVFSLQNDPFLSKHYPLERERGKNSPLVL